MPSPPVASHGPMSDVRLSDLKKSAQMFFSLIMQQEKKVGDLSYFGGNHIQITIFIY